ncbi:hypothetical protein [Mycobacterium sp. 236(2023)]|uniref:hypothetical protein n=1 Tax=Mycobacterium sp. 236(2023) TaxID=3038163 RepID=UPI0024156604|nr:hypothetical protein [Mycobacterium sp. 236(2023)]MDG4668633.1 hypothetical protein [Mycobacterium sp. 236(2023)]
MTVPIEDVDRWDAGDVREVFNATRSRAEAAFEASNGIAELPALIRVITIAAAATLLLAACSPSEPESLGPPVPTGATEIPGGPMEPTPIVPSPVIPETQRQAQDTVNRYLLDTVNAMPQGTTLDGTRYIVGDGTSFCEDNPSGDDPPVRVTDWRDVDPPAGTDIPALIDQTGALWTSWGWQVLKRDGFDKPNRFGYALDGYVLQISARPDPAQPPSLIASSPCFRRAGAKVTSARVLSSARQRDHLSRTQSLDRPRRRGN